MKKILIITVIFSLFFASCKSADFDKLGTTNYPEKDDSANLEVQELQNLSELEKLAIEEDVKEVDIPKTIVYVDRPIYYPVEEPQKRTTGKDAVKESNKAAMVEPEKFIYGTMYYDYDPDQEFIIFTQPYRVTDLWLEPGEQVIEMPMLSEEKVWEIGAGVSRVNGLDTQHFFLKPAYSGLITSFIIMTDKRVYHLTLKSFKDYNIKNEIYVIGVILYYIFTGRRSLNFNSSQISKISQKCVDRNHNNRYNSVEEIIVDVSKILEKEENTTHKTSLTTKIKIDSDIIHKDGLNELSVEILQKAVEKDGSILYLKTLEGIRIQVGEDSYVPNNAREEAELENVIDSLENYGYIRSSDYKRDFFKVTKKGYDFFEKQVVYV